MRFNGSVFLWVIRGLQTVGAQIRAVGAKSRQAGRIYPLFQ